MARLSRKDEQQINQLRGQFPASVAIHVRRSMDGGFVADITDFPGLSTEGETLSELIDMLNDALWTHFEVPSKYRAFMPTYVPPLKMAQDFDVFPVRKQDAKVRMTRTSSSAGSRRS